MRSERNEKVEKTAQPKKVGHLQNLYILILQQWEEKAKTSQQYKRAIEFWTKRDIQKRDIAIKNNLNYIVLWNKTDIDNFIQNL